MEENERGRVLIKELIETVIKVSEISDYRSSVKKEYCNLARSWLKLLTPMFEEIRDSKEKLNQNSVRELPKLKEAIILALELPQFGSGWSTIYMAELKQKLAELYSVKDPQAIFVFNFRTHFGGGKSTRFGLIYDSVENAKKYEPKYRLIRL